MLLELDGARLLTDPVLRGRLAHLRRHAPPVGALEPVDAVLVSHVHRDHLDRRSLRRVATASTVAVVPEGCASLLAGLAFGSVRELNAGASLALDGAVVEAVPAWHEARRDPGTPVRPAVGYLAAGVWFAGDTGLHPDLARLRGRVEVALVPIWGWGPSLGPGHLDPGQAAQAIALVRPAVVVPIHWGTLLPLGLGRSHAHVLTDPPRRFAARVAELAPEVRVATLPVGGSLEL